MNAEERAWLERLVADLGPRVLAYIRRVYGDLRDAEDILAETFCRAATNIDALRDHDRTDLYVLTITRNLCRDRFRRLHPDSVPGGHLDRCPGQAPGPDETAAAGERRQALHKSLAALPEHLREVVVLRLSTGLRFEEIAELLAIPLGTALSRMHAAVERLRQELSGYHEF